MYKKVNEIDGTEDTTVFMRKDDNAFIPCVEASQKHNEFYRTYQTDIKRLLSKYLVGDLYDIITGYM